MKKFVIYFVFILAFTAPVNAQGFIGTIVLETENFEIGEKSSITCYLKLPYCKMEINSVAKEGNATYTLFFDNQRSDVIMWSSGTKTVVPLASLRANKYLENILVAIPTTRSQSIAGYAATEINLKSTNAVIQCYVAPELNIVFPSLLNTSGINKSLQENSIAGTPLEILVKDLSGKPVFSQKITSVNAQALDDGIFNAE
jgi:hypothetical protein